MTEDMSKLHKAQAGNKIKPYLYESSKGALPRHRKNSVDLNAPMSSCAIVDTCFMSSVFAPLAEAHSEVL